MPDRDVTSWIRAGAIGFALLAMAATAVEVGREGKGPTAPIQSATARDPLAAELQRCDVITPASKRDDGCERAWAENRRRFLGSPHVAPDTSDPEPPFSASPGGRR